VLGEAENVRPSWYALADRIIVHRVRIGEVEPENHVRRHKAHPLSR
jgi:hypothetical protein